jgi:hypothetical protein
MPSRCGLVGGNRERCIEPTRGPLASSRLQAPDCSASIGKSPLHDVKARETLKRAAKIRL